MPNHPLISQSRKDFPILKREVNGYPLAYLDNAATTQKPKSVIAAITNFYENHNSNVSRGVYTLAEEATEIYESGRDAVANFIGAKDSRTIIFTSGTTESINLVASAWGQKNLKKGDRIILTEMEHHSNIVPWQLAANHTESNWFTGRSLRKASLIWHCLKNYSKTLANYWPSQWFPTF